MTPKQEAQAQILVGLAGDTLKVLAEVLDGDPVRTIRVIIAMAGLMIAQALAADRPMQLLAMEELEGAIVEFRKRVERGADA